MQVFHVEHLKFLQTAERKNQKHDTAQPRKIFFLMAVFPEPTAEERKQKANAKRNN